MSILLHYVTQLVDSGLIHRVDCWDFTRKPSDAIWLHKRLLAHGANPNVLIVNTYDYTPVPVKLVKAQQKLTVFVAADSDAHLLLSSGVTDVAEIVIGAYSGTMHILRQERQGTPVTVQQNGIFVSVNKWNKVTLEWQDSGELIVDIDDGCKTCVMRMTLQTETSCSQLNVSVAGWPAAPPVHWCFQDCIPDTKPTDFADPRFRLMQPFQKTSWAEYYKYYRKEDYDNCIIIKCDDDIVYIDTERFERFLQKRRALKSVLFLFPNIWNNETITFYQQQLGFLPPQVFKAEYHPKGFGNLWMDGKAAERIHNYFIDNLEKLRLEGDKCNDQIILHPMNDRISVNFFALLSDDLYVYQIIGWDDEHDLSQMLPGLLNRSIAVDMSLMTAHLSFFKQQQGGSSSAMDVSTITKRYLTLANRPHLLIWVPSLVWKTKNVVCTYNTMLDSLGVSGTETCMLEIAVQLVQRFGYRVTIAYEGNDVISALEHGVRYVSSSAMTAALLQSVTAFSPLFWNHHPSVIDIVQKLPPKTPILWWMHCMCSNDQYMLHKKLISIGYDCRILAPSEWVAQTLCNMYDQQAKIAVIPNSVSEEVFMTPLASIPLPASKRGNFVFHACFERGGIQAIQVYKRYKSVHAHGTLHIASYHDDSAQYPKQDDAIRDNIVFHKSLSKKGLKALLDQCDYFVYPLVLPDGRVHHDTYACVVHEAMACGVIVITWDVACMRSVYGDNIVALPTPSETEYIPHNAFGTNKKLLDDESIELMFDAIKALECDSKKKEDLRNKAREWALANTWSASADKLHVSLNPNP